MVNIMHANRLNADHIDWLVVRNELLSIEPMAAALDEATGKARRPELLSKIDTEANINDARLLTNEEGVLTALDDK